MKLILLSNHCFLIFTPSALTFLNIIMLYFIQIYLHKFYLINIKHNIIFEKIKQLNIRPFLKFIIIIWILVKKYIVNFFSF